MNKGSKYWENPWMKFDLIELANTQRSITNFVKILTRKEIPVEFTTTGDSMTDGKSITISSNITQNTLDSTIGLALHEGAHCAYTNFDVPKKIGNLLLERNLIHGKEIILLLLNFVEDRRIDQLVYNMAPGYQSYYKSMYDKYFYNNTVDNGIRSNKFRKENWESYIFRIINIFNKNTDLTALTKLKEVYNILDLKNINRLKSTLNSFDIACKMYSCIRDYLVTLTKEEYAKQNQLNEKNNNPKGASIKSLKNLLKKQEDFTLGKVHKSKISALHKNKIKAISESLIKVEFITSANKKRPVHIMDGISDASINENLYDRFHSFKYTKNDHLVEQGIIKGKRLLNKLQIRNEQITLSSKRLKQGKIDPRRIYAANFEEDLFYKIDKANYKPISLNISIDGSGSMKGDKWNQTLINTIALGYMSLNMDNINMLISIRTSGDAFTRGQVPLLILAFDSKKHKLKNLKKLKYYRESGLTPEGICLEALNISNSSYYLDSYLINMSDGMPVYSDYKGKDAILDTARVINKIKKGGVSILSYFIQGDDTSYDTENNFKKMYGKDASFININNINEITKTLNRLLLKKELIS
tara:strand:- start:176 stop:1930 length:1755 start_codon:yes stop_codon:yes gene_type:complete